MKIPWGFIVSRVFQDILREPLSFIAAVLCVTVVCTAGPIVMGSKSLAVCFTPPWANRAVAMIAWKTKTSESDRRRVTEIIRNSPWYESMREVPGEEVIKEVETLAKSFGREFFRVDPSIMPGYLEITLSGRCLKEASKCQAFIDEVATDPAVDSVYSGVAIASETRMWFEFIERFVMILTAFFLFVMVTMIFLLSRISFYRRMREIYLWDLLGASPLFKRLACYAQVLSVIMTAWPISLFILYQFKKYWQHLERFFGINQNCWLSGGTILGFSILTLIFVVLSLIGVAEWAFRKSWNVSAGMDWTWTD